MTENEEKISIKTIDETLKNAIFLIVCIHVAYVSLFWLEPLGIIALIFAGLIIIVDGVTGIAVFGITLYIAFLKNVPNDYQPFWRATIVRASCSLLTFALFYNVVANWWPDILPPLFIF